MMIERRTFLLGLASVLASPVIMKVETLPFMGPIATGILSDKLPFRCIQDLQVGSMPTGDDWKTGLITEEPVTISLMRDNETLWQIMINPRAAYRWVAAEGQGLMVPKTSVLRFNVEPAHTKTAIMMISDIEQNPDWRVRRRRFSECYKWRDGNTELESISALDPVDQEMLV